MTTQSDFILLNGDRVIILTPLNAAAAEWVTENVNTEEWQGQQIVCEPRYIEHVLVDIENAGFTVEDAGIPASKRSMS